MGKTEPALFLLRVMNEIEPFIRPLVDALNATGLVCTFSSCQGHYEPDEQRLADRNHAEVRFVPTADHSAGEVESLLGTILADFKARHTLIPVHAIGYKLYTPLDGGIIDQTFVLELRPFSRFESPDRKRIDTDRAIAQLIAVVQRQR